MECTQKYDNPSPEVNANQFSRLFYSWLFPLFKYGYSNDIEAKHLYNAAEEDLSKHLGNTLERNWEQEVERASKKNTKPNLSRAIQATFLKQFILFGIGQSFQTICCRIAQPILIALLLQCFDRTKTSSPERGWIFATALILISLFSTILMHYFNLGLFRIGMQCRVATCSLIYRKMLRLNKSSIAQTAAGQVVNLVSNDVTRFDWVPAFWHYIWIMPILTVVVAGFMYNAIGVTALIGIGILVLQTVPLQGVLSRVKGRLRSKIANHTDNRVQLTSELISGIRVIKMYAWEKPFENMVIFVRNLELNKIAKASHIWGFVSAVGRFIEKLTLFLTMVAYVLLGNRLTSDKVFSMVQYFSILHIHMAVIFPIAISFYAEAKVSLKRIEMMSEMICQRELQKKRIFSRIIKQKFPTNFRTF